MILILAPGLLRVFHVSSGRKLSSLFKQLLWHLREQASSFGLSHQLAMAAKWRAMLSGRRVTRMTIGWEDTPGVHRGELQAQAPVGVCSENWLFPLHSIPRFLSESSCEMTLPWRWETRP